MRAPNQTSRIAFCGKVLAGLFEAMYVALRKSPIEYLRVLTASKCILVFILQVSGKLEILNS